MLGYWFVCVGDVVYCDLVWMYYYLLFVVVLIVGLVVFYNEKVDFIVDGVVLLWLYI